MTENWRAGKLPAAQLDRLINSLPRDDPRVILGPKVGEDAAVLDMGQSFLVAASDPVTFATDRIGWYAVQTNANDVVVLGAVPRWFFAVLLLPEGPNAAELSSGIMGDIGEACQRLGVTVCGGHTEVTAGLQRPIVIGHMLGEVPRSDLIRKDAARPGDQVVVTHGAAIEGTALIARERRSELEGQIDSEVLDRAEALLFRPGISVVPAVRAAVAAGVVHAMHDPTEEGINTGLVELATASSLGLEVYAERIPVLEETRAVCDRLQLDPLGLIASGSLLLVTPPVTTESVMVALRADGIPCALIAELRSASFGVRVRKEGQLQPLVPPDRDELARLVDHDQEDPRAL